MILTQQRPTVTDSSMTAPLVSMVLTDGSVVAAAPYDNGRSAMSLGHIDTPEFLENAERVFDDIGTSGDEALEPHAIVRRHALVQERRSGSVMVLWSVTSTGDQVTEQTPGAVPVTLIEI